MPHFLSAVGRIEKVTSLHYEIFLCQEKLDEIVRVRQPLVIEKRGSYVYIPSEFTT